MSWQAKSAIIALSKVLPLVEGWLQRGATRLPFLIRGQEEQIPGRFNAKGQEAYYLCAIHTAIQGVEDVPNHFSCFDDRCRELQARI